MPKRDAAYRIPDSALTSILVCEVSLSDQRGILFLASEPGFFKALGVQEAQFWDAILKRADVEFARRALRPVLSQPLTLAASSPLPEHLPTPGRVVWIPFRIPEGSCHLGLGV